MNAHALWTSVDASDRRVCDRVRAWAPPRWFRVWMVAATRFGDGPGWAAVGVGLVAAGPHGRAAAAAATVAALLASIVFMALKRRFRRPRPCDVAPHPLFDLRPPDAFSFPSGHTMNACAAATVLALSFPPLLPALAFLAGSVGASRVVLGLHYPSDVGAGAALGTLIGACVYAGLR
jgi:undecaprenyl-diphosphatase